MVKQTPNDLMKKLIARRVFYEMKHDGSSFKEAFQRVMVDNDLVDVKFSKLDQTGIAEAVKSIIQNASATTPSKAPVAAMQMAPIHGVSKECDCGTPHAKKPAGRPRRSAPPQAALPQVAVESPFMEFEEDDFLLDEVSKQKVSRSAQPAIAPEAESVPNQKLKGAKKYGIAAKGDVVIQTREDGTFVQITEKTKELTLDCGNNGKAEIRKEVDAEGKEQQLGGCFFD